MISQAPLESVAVRPVNAFKWTRLECECACWWPGELERVAWWCGEEERAVSRENAGRTWGRREWSALMMRMVKVRQLCNSSRLLFMWVICIWYQVKRSAYSPCFSANSFAMRQMKGTRCVKETKNNKKRRERETMKGEKNKRSKMNEVTYVPTSVWLLSALHSVRCLICKLL